jgi:hypothetical protein
MDEAIIPSDVRIECGVLEFRVSEKDRLGKSRNPGAVWRYQAQIL